MVLYWRSLLQRYLRPMLRAMDPEDARRKHNYLTLAYIFLAWNAAGLAYYSYRSAAKEGHIQVTDTTPAHKWARRIAKPETTLYEFDPFNKTGPKLRKFEYNHKEYMEEYEEKVEAIERYNQAIAEKNERDAERARFRKSGDYSS